MTENELGNEKVVNKLTRDNITLVEKILNKIQDLKEAVESHKDKKSRKRYLELKNIEKKYLNAIDKAGYKYSNRKIVRTKRDEVDVQEEIQYNRKAFSFQHKNFPGEKETGSEAHRLAIWWTKRQGVISGDQTLISMNDRWYLVEKFDDADNNYQVEEYITKAEYNSIFKEIQEYGRSGKIESIQRSTYEIDKLNKQRDTLGRKEPSLVGDETQHGRQDNSIQRVGEKESQRGQTHSNGRGNSKSGGANKQSLNKRKFSLKNSNGERNTQKSNRSGKVKYSLKDTVEKDVLKHYGKTYRWNETGYIFKDGTRLDLSGRAEGASGGYRSIDHRDIFDDYDIDGTEAMVEFMNRGNIRVMPESPGINLQVEPTEEQYRLIQNMVENLGWNDEYFSVDFDNEKGNTIDSLSYEGKVSGRKVVSDIKYYFTIKCLHRNTDEKCFTKKRE